MKRKKKKVRVRNKDYFSCDNALEAIKRMLGMPRNMRRNLFFRLYNNFCFESYSRRFAWREYCEAEQMIREGDYER